MTKYVSVPIPEHLVLPVMRLVLDQPPHRLIDGPTTANLIQVPVPEFLVKTVMRFVLEQEDTLTPSPSNRPRFREWTPPQLKALYESTGPAIGPFCEMMHLLSEHAEGIPVEDIERLVLTQGASALEEFKPVTKWMVKTFGNGDWPILVSQDNWSMDLNTSAIWASIVLPPF